MYDSLKDSSREETTLTEADEKANQYKLNRMSRSRITLLGHEQRKGSAGDYADNDYQK